MAESKRSKAPQNLHFVEWLEWNLKPERDPGSDDDWREFFAIWLWCLWRWRNDLTFHNKMSTMEAKIFSVQSYVKEIRTTFSVQSVMHGSRARALTIWVGWSPPSSGWVALNTDGCCKLSNNQAGGGGIIRDHAGKWICR